MTQLRVAAGLADLADAQLMRRVQAGDAEAFGALYDRFVSRAYGLARAIGRASDADDIVQEAFLSVWRGRSAFRPERGTVLAWVMGIARNRAIDSLRRQGRHDRHRADAEMAERLRVPGDVEDDIIGSEQAARLRSTLARLPPTQRDVIALAYFGELSTPEIAAELSLPLGTVKGRMRLGLVKLRSPVAEDRGRAV